MRTFASISPSSSTRTKVVNNGGHLQRIESVEDPKILILYNLPDEFECDAGFKLDVGDIAGRLGGTSHHAGAPRPSRPELRQRGDLYPLAQEILLVNALYLSVVGAVRVVLEHGSQITVIVVVK